MSLIKAPNRINRLKNRYLTLRLLEIVLLVVASIFFVFTILYFFRSSVATKILASTIISLGLAIERVIRYRLLSYGDQSFVRYLNSTYPRLEHSADLLLSSNRILTGLESLQHQKISQQFDELYPEIKIPNFFPQSLGIFAFCSGTYLFLTSFIAQPISSNTKRETNLAPATVYQNNPIATIDFLSVSISPPAYTMIKSFQSSSSDLKIPEGSRVSWSVKFSSKIKEAKILLSGKDSINLLLSGNTYQAHTILNESGFYQIQWNSEQKTSRSDYFKIEIIKDQSPKVSIDNLSQFTQLTFSHQLKVKVQSSLHDDYGLASATIIATVSKGSGEAVKFREEKLHFDYPNPIRGRQLQAALTLDLPKMGMEPGDELYFYVEALDNRMPSPNYSRTETFFIAMQDTTQQVLVEDEGLGVDLMPEYFRSQRQIIIDTEKLLKEKKKKSLQEFKSTSNELGYDQKVLRLRYGQFLGEEFDGQIGNVSATDENENHESTIEKFGHAHDKENEHNLVADKKQAPVGHSHEGEIKDPEAKEDPLKAFAHNHDDGEQATFFIQSVRAKLKAALAVMWDAELYLRLYEPQKSLPHQYAALKLLKEISNDSRIYVHRTGFDPPPLKEEKRLSGDLAEVHNSVAENHELSKETFFEIRKALLLLESLNDRNVMALSAAERNQFHKAGQELAVVALAQPGEFLEGLSLLKEVEEGNLSGKDLVKKLVSIQQVFWKVLPSQTPSPTKERAMTHRLDRQFLESLKELQHE